MEAVSAMVHEGSRASVFEIEVTDLAVNKRIRIDWEHLELHAELSLKTPALIMLELFPPRD